MVLPIGSMYAIYGNIYYQYTYGVPQKPYRLQYLRQWYYGVPQKTLQTTNSKSVR